MRTSTPNQTGLRQKVIKIPIKPGITRMKDGKLLNIERPPNKLFSLDKVVGLTEEYRASVQLSQSIFKLKTAEKERIKGIPKSDKDGIKGAKIPIPVNTPAAIGA